VTKIDEDTRLKEGLNGSCSAIKERLREKMRIIESWPKVSKQ
jgi:hypothetical protein